MSAVAETLTRPDSEGRAPEARRAGAHLFAADLIGYGLVSAAALALDWSLLVAFVKAGLNYQIAAAISFSLGMLLAYAGSVRLIFRGRRERSRGAEAFGFFAIGLLGLALNQGLIFGFVHYAGLPVALAKAPTAGCVFSFNFLARRSLLFVAKPAAKPGALG
jgi:putative flippase GtrA